jgi:hypothetical protein
MSPDLLKTIEDAQHHAHSAVVALFQAGLLGVSRAQ